MPVERRFLVEGYTLGPPETQVWITASLLIPSDFLKQDLPTSSSLKCKVVGTPQPNSRLDCFGCGHTKQKAGCSGNKLWVRSMGTVTIKPTKRRTDCSSPLCNHPVSPKLLIGWFASPLVFSLIEGKKKKIKMIQIVKAVSGQKKLWPLIRNFFEEGSLGAEGKGNTRLLKSCNALVHLCFHVVRLSLFPWIWFCISPFQRSQSNMSKIVNLPVFDWLWKNSAREYIAQTVQTWIKCFLNTLSLLTSSWRVCST